MSTNLGSEYFEALLTLILEQRDEAIQYFNLPLVLYRNQGFAVLNREDELENWLASYRESLAPRGIRMVRTKIMERNEISAGMTNYLVQHYFCNLGGLPVFTATLQYFMRETGDAQAIEMIEQL